MRAGCHHLLTVEPRRPSGQCRISSPWRPRVRRRQKRVHEEAGEKACTENPRQGAHATVTANERLPPGPPSPPPTATFGPFRHPPKGDARKCEYENSVHTEIAAQHMCKSCETAKRKKAEGIGAPRKISSRSGASHSPRLQPPTPQSCTPATLRAMNDVRRKGAVCGFAARDWRRSPRVERGGAGGREESVGRWPNAAARTTWRTGKQTSCDDRCRKRTLELE